MKELIIKVDEEKMDIEGNAPVIDKPQELIRCKDCCYWLPMNRFHEDYHPDYGECELNKWVRSQNWFCADGKHKEI